MEESNKKILTVSFVVAGLLSAYVVTVLLDFLAQTTGFGARMMNEDVLVHGLPVVFGFGTFLYLQFNKKIKTWADEVVVEVKKVVWPSRKDTVAMTIVVCVMLVLSGVVLGLFDFVSNIVVNYIMEI